MIFALFVSFFSGSNSITSLIPAFLGIPIIIFSALSIAIPSKRKIFMHIAVLVGLITALGGLDVVRSFPTIFSNLWADVSKLTLLITGTIYVILCVKSFIFARKNQ